MFTGLIEEVGQIKSVQPIAGGKKLCITAKEIMDDIAVDNSIAVNGTCLTVIKYSDEGFWVEAVAETLEKTTLGIVKVGTLVNLERAMKLSDRLGGHIVQGHVNGMSKITRIEKLGDNYALDIEVNEDLERYIISEGSIALDGISLTIAHLSGNIVGINIIPHTWANTNLKSLNIGDMINTEADVIVKYVEKLIPNFSKEKDISRKKLNTLGF